MTLKLKFINFSLTEKKLDMK